MRTRSVTIYAQNQDDYLKQCRKQPLVFKEKLSNLVRTKLPEDYLSFENNYEMSLRQPDLCEQQEKDEIDLLHSIDNLNTCYRHRKNSSSYDESDCLSKQSTNVSYDMSMVLLNENFYAFDQTVKVMLVGNKGVGKTSFLTSLLTKFNSLHLDGIKSIPLHLPRDTILKPTLTLEISKRLLKIKNKLINLEFWDTNEQIFNSPIIKTYMKICHSFILVCDLSSEFSTSFIEKQVEHIIKFSINPNILLVANNKGVGGILNEKILYDLVDRYGVTHCSVNNFTISVLESYLNKTIVSNNS